MAPKPHKSKSSKRKSALPKHHKLSKKIYHKSSVNRHNPRKTAAGSNDPPQPANYQANQIVPQSGQSQTTITQDIKQAEKVTKTVQNFLKWLTRLHLDKALANKSPYTVFVPSNAAFKRLPLQAVKFLDDKNSLKSVLLNHIIGGNMYTYEQLSKFKTVGSLNGPLCLDASSGVLKINGASVVQKDITAGNSIIHVVDGILWPSRCSIQISNIAK